MELKEPLPRRVTLADVALAAGVSRTTASYVLAGREDVRVPQSTRDAVLIAAKNLGYRRNALAASLRSGKLNTLGILAPFPLTVANIPYSAVYYKDLTLAIAAAAFEAGMTPLLFSEHRGEAITLEELTDRRADAIVLTSRTDVDIFVAAAEAMGVPHVVISSHVSQWQVHEDNDLGIRLAMEHLWNLGHRHIAYLSYGQDDNRVELERRGAFHGFLNERGVPGAQQPHYYHHNADELAALVKTGEGPTAACCFSDELATTLLALLRIQGVRVPEDFSLTGFDDTILAYVSYPSLTSVHSPIQEMAREAVRLAQMQLRGESPPPSLPRLLPTLSVRQSTAPPPR